MALSFQDLKTEILNRAKRLELCESYQQALLAEDYAALILSSVSLIEWTWQSSIVDDALLDEFPEADLNAAGVYISDAVITDPDRYIYLLRGTHTVNVTGNNRARVRVMATVVSTINVSDNAYLDFKAYNETVTTINLSENASMTMEAIHASAVAVNEVNASAINGTVSDAATVSVVTNDTAFAKVKAYNSAIITPVQNDASEIVVQTYQAATQNLGGL